jgi:hypothetical protein
MATAVPETERDPGHYGDEAEVEESSQNRIVEKDGKYELLDTDAWEVLGYSFPTWRKWQILGVVFLIQISMNTNASMYANAVQGISKKFDISEQAARIPQMTFLVAYAFGMTLLRLSPSLAYLFKAVNCGLHGVKNLVSSSPERLAECATLMGIRSLAYSTT